MNKLRSYCNILEADASAPSTVLSEGIIFPEDFICKHANISDDSYGIVCAKNKYTKCPIYDSFFEAVRNHRLKGLEKKAVLEE